MEFKITNIMSFILASAKMKYLGINLTKYVQNLYEENCRTLTNKIRGLNKWRNVPFLCSEIGIFNIMKILFLPNSCIDSIRF